MKFPVREMSDELQTSFLSPVNGTDQQRDGKVPVVHFLAMTLLFPIMIVAGNFVLSVVTPITGGPEDDMSMLDSVWRLVQGQHLGIDFHDPLGFGFLQVAAMLWRVLGPNSYVLRGDVVLFALAIVLCAAIVAARQLRNASGFATLFCITVALVASGPSIYGYNQYIGAAMSYDRLIMAGLLVMFVQSFANDLDVRPERGYIDHLTSGFLLNILLLIKISAVVVGIVILTIGLILRGPFSRSVLAIALVLMILGVMATIDFAVTGTSLSAIIHDYRMAAEGRVGAISPREALWFARRVPVLAVVGLMGLYVVSRPSRCCSHLLWNCFCIVASYWLCQVVLNMSNGSRPDLIFLAPAGAIAIVTWTDAGNTPSSGDRFWHTFHPRRLNEISARQLIPLLLVAMVLVPELSASLGAIKLDYSIASGSTKVVTVSANRGIAFKIPEDSSSGLVSYINDSILAIERLDASHETIANLDYMNPFPALFLSPAPKGVWVWWNFSRYTNVPIGYSLRWQEVIGDACIVTEPKHSPETPVQYYSEPLINAVEPHLSAEFTLVYEDKIWKIWKKNSGCGGIN
jgi:hypothetical protein